MCISGLIFHLLRGRVSGENCHFRLRSTTSGTHFEPHNTHSSFPSTVDNFRYTVWSPQYSFIASYDAKHLYFTVGVGSTVLFFLREINRFLEALSSFCIFEKALFLDTRDSILETRSSNVSSIEAQGSSLEVRVSSVNLLLSGTVTINPTPNQYFQCLGL